MTGPLAGIKVLELSQIIAGPFCGMNLADLGAEVVKLEPPGGETLRALGAFMPGESKFFHTLNRGKRSLVVDLREQQGQQIVHSIIPQYDVFIVNSRPGVPKRLGVDYDTLRALRPDLIYFENTGYGTEGPSAERSGSDIVAQAYSGLMAGDAKVDEYGAPLLTTSTAPADYTAGLAGAMGICAALLHREKHGEGQYLSTTLLGAALVIQAAVVSRQPVFDAMVTDPMLERVNEVRRSGGTYADMLAVKGDLVALLGLGFRLYYGGYVVKDGAIILGALTDANRDGMREVLGVEDDPSADPDYNALDPETVPALQQLMERVRATMLTRTMDEWVAAFDAVGAPASKVNLPEEMPDDPQVEQLGIMLDLEHELTGPERMVGPIVEMSATATGAAQASPPLDGHTDEVLAEHGFSADEIAALRKQAVIGKPPE